MDKLNFSIQNIINGDGISLAITGMVIVFMALAIISTFIALLPKMLPVLESILPEEHAHHGPTKKAKKNDNEVLAAIGYALVKLNSEKRHKG
jgi:oxaloacetate decarboxylase gamma subunit